MPSASADWCGCETGARLGLTEIRATAERHLAAAHSARVQAAQGHCWRNVRHTRVELAEYHLWAWRNYSSIQVGVANAEIRTGVAGNRPVPLSLSLLSSKYKFDSWDSRSKLVPIQRSYAAGASATEIGATFRNGCSTSGKSRWIQTSAGKPRPWSPFPAEIADGRAPVLGASCTEPYPEYAELARDTSEVAAYNSSVLRGDLHERLN